MKLKSKSLAVSVTCLTVAVILFGASLYNLQLAQQYHSMVIGEKNGLRGHLYVKVNNEFWCENSNTVQDIGEQRIRDFLADYNHTGTAATNDTKWISLSPDSAPAASATQLTNEYSSGGLSRASGTVTFINNTAFNVTYTFTSTADSQPVTSAGLHWHSSGDGNMYAAADLSNAPTLDTDDTLEASWICNQVSG